jgi:hypothetical protein
MRRRGSESIHGEANFLASFLRQFPKRRRAVKGQAPRPSGPRHREPIKAPWLMRFDVVAVATAEPPDTGSGPI